MESTSGDPRSAQAQLAAADAARERLASGIQLPAGLLPALAAAVAIQIACAGVGIASQSTAGLGLVLAGLAVFSTAAAWSLHRFRRINGVRVNGLASRVVLGSGATSTMVFLGAFAAATWAAFETQWWLVALAAVAGGVGYAYGARQWWHAYRGDPARYAGGVSPRFLAGLAVVTCLGFVALMVAG